MTVGDWFGGDSIAFWLMVTFLIGCCGALNIQPTMLREAVRTSLARTFLGSWQTLLEMQAYLELRIPKMPKIKSSPKWQEYADRLRKEILERIVFRGEAKNWRKAKTKVEWLDTLDGKGYRIRKLRYEAVPGLWIPSLLYEPETVKDKTPAVLYLKGHETKGKAATYAQAFCINMAKRGVFALSPEWMGFGQLNQPDFSHGCMNQLDLCGTSGLAVFYLSMVRGLDVLLSLPTVDPDRIAVTGLSGGGWQTIFLSALDTRVKLANPVAGYSSLFTRLRHFKDLGDSEQMPCDLATIADYTHLTAFLAPRPTLLTYCAYDECCFEAGYALPPLLDAAMPVFRLLRRSDNLAWHINYDPGTHNYEEDNREAFYRFIAHHFFSGDQNFPTNEIPCDDELKSENELTVPLPESNATFNTIAKALCQSLPRDATVPKDSAAFRQWQQKKRRQLAQIVRAKDYTVRALDFGTERHEDLTVRFWQLRLGDEWTVPATELEHGKAKGTVILIADDGRKNADAHAERLLAQGNQVIAVDLLFFGEMKIERQNLFALFLACVGERPLGIQASQLTAIARWVQAERKIDSVTVCAVGPRSTVIALVAAALEPNAIGGLELHGCLDSLKSIVEQNWTVDKAPELFCFGLLEAFDIPQLAALVSPRPIERH